MKSKQWVLSTILLTLISALVVLITNPAIASQKLGINVSVGEHPYLSEYEAGKIASLGDQWNFEIQVLDSDGDPAEGATVRIYNGSKSIGTGKVQSEGFAYIKVGFTKVGNQSLKIVATDNEPAGKGESTIQVKVQKPQTIKALPKVWAENLDSPDDSKYVLRPDVKLIMQNGCSDYGKYWWSFPAKYMKSIGEPLMASWPFVSTKSKGTWLGGGEVEFNFDQLLQMQNTAPRRVADKYSSYLLDERGILDLEIGSQAICQTDSGELLILS